MVVRLHHMNWCWNGLSTGLAQKYRRFILKESLSLNHVFGLALAHFAVVSEQIVLLY